MHCQCPRPRFWRSRRISSCETDRVATHCVYASTKCSDHVCDTRPRAGYFRWPLTSDPFAAGTGRSCQRVTEWTDLPRVARQTSRRPAWQHSTPRGEPQPSAIHPTLRPNPRSVPFSVGTNEQFSADITNWVVTAMSKAPSNTPLRRFADSVVSRIVGLVTRNRFQHATGKRHSDARFERTVCSRSTRRSWCCTAVSCVTAQALTPLLDTSWAKLSDANSSTQPSSITRRASGSS